MKTITNTFAVLAFGGLAAASAVAQDAAPIAPVAVAPAATVRATNDVGISSRDGITVSGTDTLVTRNGVTEKINNDLKLDNGMRIKSDGTVVASDGGTFQLRGSQILTFDGKLINAPVGDGTAPTALPPGTVVQPTAVQQTTTTTTAPLTTTPPSAGVQATNKEAADLAASEAQRRAQSATPPASDSVNGAR